MQQTELTVYTKLLKQKLSHVFLSMCFKSYENYFWCLNLKYCIICLEFQIYFVQCSNVKVYIHIQLCDGIPLEEKQEKKKKKEDRRFYLSSLCGCKDINANQI